MTTPDIAHVFAAADKAGIARSRTDVPGSENLLCASDAQLARFASTLAAPAQQAAPHGAVFGLPVPFGPEIDARPAQQAPSLTVGVEPVALPKPPSHPDARVFTWTSHELRAIEKYGQECANAALAFCRAAQAQPSHQPAQGVGLTDEQCDQAAAQAMDRLAKARDIHARDLNPDITTHHTLRRELIRAGAALAQAPAAEPEGMPEPVGFPNAAAWLVAHGRAFVDKAFVSEASADQSIAERKDDALKVTLHTRSQVFAYGAAKRREALEEAAKAVQPSNWDRPDDWTEYAKTKAACAAAIRALSNP